MIFIELNYIYIYIFERIGMRVNQKRENARVV